MGTLLGDPKSFCDLGGLGVTIQTIKMGVTQDRGGGMGYSEDYIKARGQQASPVISMMVILSTMTVLNEYVCRTKDEVEHTLPITLYSLLGIATVALFAVRPRIWTLRLMIAMLLSFVVEEVYTTLTHDLNNLLIVVHLIIGWLIWSAYQRVRKGVRYGL